jgi:hypothetical protein
VLTKIWPLLKVVFGKRNSLLFEFFVEKNALIKEEKEHRAIPFIQALLLTRKVHWVFEQLVFGLKKFVM